MIPKKLVAVSANTSLGSPQGSHVTLDQGTDLVLNRLSFPQQTFIHGEFFQPPTADSGVVDFRFSVATDALEKVLSIASNIGPLCLH